MCKRDAAQEAEIQSWIEAVLGEKFPDGKPYEDVLKDGVVLCRLMNKLQPGIVDKVNETGPNFKMMENVNKYGFSRRKCRLWIYVFNEPPLNPGFSRH